MFVHNWLQSHQSNMMSKVLTILLVTAVNILANHFMHINNHWVSTSAFHRHDGYALLDHVIKTLPLFLVDCLALCQDTIRCFSVNYVHFPNGTFWCELNWSSKEQNEDWFQQKHGYQYAEPPKFHYCDENTCAEKKAEKNGWFKYNTSSFKIFYEQKIWANAQSHCRSLGSDLATFDSLAEYRFVKSVLLYPLFVSRRDLDEYSLFNGAVIQIKDNKNGIYFDGQNDYARIPSFGTHKSDWTWAFWHYKSTNNYGFIQFFNDVISSKRRQFAFYVFNGRVALDFLNVNRKNVAPGLVFSVSKMENEKWHHITATWNREAKEAKMYLNSVLQSSKVSILNNVDLYNTGQATYQVGAINGAKFFKGYFTDLFKEIASCSMSYCCTLKRQYW